LDRRQFFHSAALMAVVSDSPVAFLRPRGGTRTAAQTREELVTVRTADDLIQTGLLVTPVETPRRPVAVIWIHGAGQNFYFPSYVSIARATAARGYPFLTVNTRMHDIGSSLAYRSEGTIRGGMYWGLPSKESLDIAAWVACATERGYPHVVLVGHSAGGPAARGYVAERRDPRVIGLVMASVAVDPSQVGVDGPERLKTAREMVASGRSQDFLPNLRISAATYVDYADTPPEMRDFYGTKTSNPAITRVRCPLLAWYGSEEPSVGTAEDLDRLPTLIARHPGGPARVDTRLIDGADHLYARHEDQIAQVLTDWLAALPAAERPPE
jgi:pimeloyl-ACP methyl ester carboxylesterase